MTPPRSFTFAVIILFIILVFLPVGYVLSALFWKGDVHTLFDQRYISLAKNSLELSFGTTFLSLIIGVPIAFLLSRTNLWYRAFLKPFFVIPILIPPYIHAIVWNQLNLAIRQILFVNINSLWGAMVVMTLSYFPFVVLIIFSGLQAMDKSLEEASLLLHGKWQTIRRITLPLVFPHIFSGAVFIFIFSIIDFGVPDILHIHVWTVEIFIQFSAFYNDKAAIILSLPIIILTLLLIIAQKWYMKERTYVQICGDISKPMMYDLKYWNIPALLFCITVLLLSACVPVVVLLMKAGGVSNYLVALQTSESQIIFSLMLSAVGSGAIVILGCSAAYLTERLSGKIKRALEFASVIPFAIPAITAGICLIKIWNQPIIDTIYSSSSIILLGYMVRFYPFSYIIFSSGVKQLNPRMEEAAMLISSNWIKILFKIILPRLKPALLTGFFIVFILSFAELGTTLLLIPPGKETIPIKIYNLMHYGAYELVNALCVILIILILALSNLFRICYKRIYDNRM